MTVGYEEEYFILKSGLAAAWHIQLESIIIIIIIINCVPVLVFSVFCV
jgi:hypothetical protein